MRLYSQQYPRLCAFLGTFLHRWADIEDVLQETSVVLWEKFSEFTPVSESTVGEDFGRWACTIARHKLMHAMRAHQRATLPIDEQLIDRISHAHHQMADELEARREALKRCLARLSDSDRSLVDACYHGDRAYHQVAQSLGRPVNSVYKSLGRIRKTLLDCIERTLRREARL